MNICPDCPLRISLYFVLRVMCREFASELVCLPPLYAFESDGQLRAGTLGVADQGYSNQQHRIGFFHERYSSQIWNS